MPNQALDYGDGGNWSGTADGLSVTMGFNVQFSLADQEVGFQVQAGQSALIAAIALMNAWNASWPNEASMPNAAEATVRFAKQGEDVRLMRVKADSGAWQDLPATVNGYVVKNV